MGTMKPLLTLLVSALGALGAIPASAAPTTIDYDSIIVSTSEDFETYSSGLIPSTLDANGFSFSTPGGVFITGDALFCGEAGDNCLLGQTLLDAPRTFDGFNSGTTAFGFQLHMIGQNDNIRVSVNSGSSSQDFILSDNGNFGFFDPLGIDSIVFLNLGDTAGGRGNYSFDNIITTASSTAVVPLPASLVLLLSAFGVGGLLLGRGRTVPA